MIIQKCLIALLLCSSQVASADAILAHFSFTGSFANDSDVQFFDFSISADTTLVSINTLSLIGGTNAAGEVITGGGFNPYLSLWDQSTGNWVFDTAIKNTADEALISSASSYSYGTLMAGNYILALSQFDNVAAGTNLSAGFAADLGLASFAGSPPFTLNGGGGSGHWAVDFHNVDSASISAVPLPGTFGFMVSGLLGMAALIRRKVMV
jgi:hypothetical protein